MNGEHVIELQHVTKTFKQFALNDVSFSVKKGYITGFIGANGMGKSTTIKLIMNLLQPDRGEINVFGLDYKRHEKEIKERIGFVFDSNVFYEHVTLEELKTIIKPAYKRWDDERFHHYIEKFELPRKKKIRTFSKGMLMKTSLAVALSHQADLIIMDEPTSGLDPIFRREILDILQDIMQDEEKTIFFSTHITTDLDRIADYIIFIHEGEIVFAKEIQQIEKEYAIVKGETGLLDRDTEREFVGIKRSPFGFEALTKNLERTKELFGDSLIYEQPTLEDIMFYTKKGTDGYVETHL